MIVIVVVIDSLLVTACAVSMIKAAIVEIALGISDVWHLFFVADVGVAIARVGQRRRRHRMTELLLLHVAAIVVVIKRTVARVPARQISAGRTANLVTVNSGVSLRATVAKLATTHWLLALIWVAITCKHCVRLLDMFVVVLVVRVMVVVVVVASDRVTWRSRVIVIILLDVGIDIVVVVSVVEMVVMVAAEVMIASVSVHEMLVLTVLWVTGCRRAVSHLRRSRRAHGKRCIIATCCSSYRWRRVVSRRRGQRLATWIHCTWRQSNSAAVLNQRGHAIAARWIVD